MRRLCRPSGAGATVAKSVSVSVSMFLLAGCLSNDLSVSPKERAQQASRDIVSMSDEQEPVREPITLANAIARAIKYNLDFRTKMMQQAIARGVSDLDKYELLPDVVASTGYTVRSNDGASVSKNLSTGVVSTEQSSSQETRLASADLSAAFSVLDFGVSWARSRQNVLRENIAAEQRRKALQAIIKEVRTEYWRALTADILAGKLDRLSAKVTKGIASAVKIEKLKLEGPIKVLNYQKNLLDTLREINILKTRVLNAKSTLGKLMNLNPLVSYDLAPAGGDELQLPSIPTKLPRILNYSLANRSELYVADLKVKIKAEDTKIIFRQMFPGLTLNTAMNFDSNYFLDDNTLATVGLKLTWNLLNIFSAPAKLDLSEAKEKLEEKRRQALTLAIMTQVIVARQRLVQSRNEFLVLDGLSRIDARLMEHTMAARDASAQSELELILRQAEQVFSEARRNQAYARLIKAESEHFFSLGLDPLKAFDQGRSITKIEAAIIKSGFAENPLSKIVENAIADYGSGAVGGDVAVPRWQPRAPAKPRKALPKSRKSPAAAEQVADNSSGPTVARAPEAERAEEVEKFEKFEDTGEREVAARVPETREEAAEPEMPDIGKASPADYQKAEVAKIMKPPDRVAKSTPGDERVKNRRPYKGHLGTYSTTRMLLFVWAEMKESYPELNDLTKLVEEINIDERGTLFRLYANGTFAQIRNLCTKIKRQDKYCLLTRI